MDREQEFEVQTISQNDRIADYLEDLAKRIREGRIHLAAGDEEIDLELRGRPWLEIEAKSDPEEGETTLEFEVTWHEEREVREVPITIGIGASGSETDEPGGGRIEPTEWTDARPEKETMQREAEQRQGQQL